MHIPPPPRLIMTPTPPLFPQARKMQTEKRLGDDIRELCHQLAKATIIPGWQDTLWQFKSAVAPSGACDVSRLPYQTNGPNGPDNHRLSCLYARLSWIIQCYWRMCVHGTENEAHIRQYVEGIERLLRLCDGHNLAYALQQCDVTGDERTLYWLSVPE